MSDWAMKCPACGITHGDWTDRGTVANRDGRTTLNLLACELCGSTVEGVRL